MTTSNGDRGTVFVVQRTSHTLPGVEEFGAVEYLLPPDVNLNYANQPLIRALRDRLRRYDPARDHVLPIGDPLAIGAAIALAADAAGGLVRVLKYDRRGHRYFPVRLDLHDRFPEVK